MFSQVKNGKHIERNFHSVACVMPRNGVLTFKNIFWEHVRVWSSLAPDQKFGPGQGPNFWLMLSVVGKDRDSVRRGGGYYPHTF